jgi:hypothetical protein
MISAMHPGGAGLYITIIGWTDGENSAFAQGKRKAHAGTVIGGA